MLHARTQLVAIALGTALCSSLALSQVTTPKVPTQAPAAPPAAPPVTGDDSGLVTAPRPGDADDWKDAGKSAPGSAAAGQAATHAATHSAAATTGTFATLDADADGRISATEAAADTSFNANFATMDADHDGYVSEVEYRDQAKATMATSQGGEHAAEGSAVVTRETFASLDTDHDGRISSTEAAAGADSGGSFKAMDGNGDGYVTDAEYRAHAKATEKPTKP